MKNFYLDPITKDLTLDDKFNIRMTKNYAEWITQKIENKLLTFYGEYFLNEEEGIPYFQKIFKKQSDLNLVYSIFYNELYKFIDREEISEIIKLELNFDNKTRKLNVYFEVKGINGEIVNEEVVI